MGLVSGEDASFDFPSRLPLYATLPKSVPTSHYHECSGNPCNSHVYCAPNLLLSKMSNRISKDDAFEVSDSTDWIETPLSSLSSVDSALRCQVCKDFYNTPMITSCNHSFCSLCIRRCLTNDGRCPACRAQDQELKLKHNPALEDVVEAFKRARPEVLDFARKPVLVLESSSPKRKRREIELEGNESPRKRMRTSTRRTRSSQNDIVIEDSAEEDEDFIPGMLSIHFMLPISNVNLQKTTWYNVLFARRE